MIQIVAFPPNSIKLFNFPFAFAFNFKVIYKLISLLASALFCVYPPFSQNGLLAAGRLFRYLRFLSKEFAKQLMPSSHSETASPLLFLEHKEFVFLFLFFLPLCLFCFSDFFGSAVSLSDKCQRCLGGMMVTAVAAVAVYEVAQRWSHSLASHHHHHHRARTRQRSPLPPLSYKNP